MVMQFQSPVQMLNFLEKGTDDLYCPDSSRYIGLYNDFGSLATWTLSDRTVLDLWDEVLSGSIKYWMEGLTCGSIMDVDSYYSPLMFCMDHYSDRWYTTNDYNIPKLLLHRAA